MERAKFEESFQEAFKGAEISPSDAVWTNVELVLEKNSGGKMKGRLLFFQLLAAASMVFAMGVGSIYFLDVQNNHVQPVSQTKTDLQKEKDPIVSGDVKKESNATHHSEDFTRQQRQVQRQVHLKEGKNSDTHATALTKSNVSSDKIMTEVMTTSNGSQIEETSVITTRALPRLVEIKNPEFKLPQPEQQADAGMVMLAKLRDEEKKYEAKKSTETKNENLWTSLGMSAGTFNPNASAAPPASSAAFVTSVPSNPSSGSSYSIGINVGGRISDRVVIQGGVSYLSQNAEYTSSTAQGDMAALNEFATVSNSKADEASRITATNPYRVNSNLQFVSLPVQAGYIVLDKAFAIQINGGIATDIFIQNTLTTENNDFKDATQGSGSDSPYRTLNFSGLVGTELSYRIGTHYRIALNPGLRYALNSIYKADVSTQVSPVTYDVGLRFKYIFN